MSAQPKPKSTGQVRSIFGLAKKAKVDSDQLHLLVGAVTERAGHRTESIRDLSFHQANQVIKELGGRPFSSSPTPRRTTQYRRARTGAKQIVTAEQLEYLASLASQRKWNETTLIRFIERQIHHYPIRTTEEANKVIEPLKAMNKREGLWWQ